MPGQSEAAALVLPSMFSKVCELIADTDSPKDARMPMPPTTPDFWKRTNQVTKDRSLFVTEDCGYLGCGPAALEPGDEIWLLEGATVPFVLRPVLHGEVIERFEIAGKVAEFFELPPKDGYELVG
jgi:hypothetical protein